MVEMGNGKREERLRFMCLALSAVSFFGILGTIRIEGHVLRCVLSLIPLACQVGMAILYRRILQLQRLRDGDKTGRIQELEERLDRLSISNLRLSNENLGLKSRIEMMQRDVSGHLDRLPDELFCNTMSESGKDRVIEMLLTVEKEDRHMQNGYALRLAIYFEALVRLNCINDCISVFARYFAPHSGRDEDTYIRTFNNMRRHIRTGRHEDEVEAYMAELSEMLQMFPRAEGKP